MAPRHLFGLSDDPGAGHYLFEDAAEGVVDSIQSFVRGT